MKHRRYQDGHKICNARHSLAVVTIKPLSIAGSTISSLQPIMTSIPRGNLQRNQQLPPSSTNLTRYSLLGKGLATNYEKASPPVEDGQSILNFQSPPSQRAKLSTHLRSQTSPRNNPQLQRPTYIDNHVRILSLQPPHRQAPRQLPTLNHRSQRTPKGSRAAGRRRRVRGFPRRRCESPIPI